MTKPKTLEQLRTEKERAETQLAQEKHKLNRLENRKKYLEKGERTKRTHRLCNLGGTIESLAPEVKALTRTEKMCIRDRYMMGRYSPSGRELRSSVPVRAPPTADSVYTSSDTSSINPI